MTTMGREARAMEYFVVCGLGPEVKTIENKSGFRGFDHLYMPSLLDQFPPSPPSGVSPLPPQLPKVHILMLFFTIKHSTTVHFIFSTSMQWIFGTQHLNPYSLSLIQMYQNMLWLDFCLAADHAINVEYAIESLRCTSLNRSWEESLWVLSFKTDLLLF